MIKGSARPWLTLLLLILLGLASMGFSGPPGIVDRSDSTEVVGAEQIALAHAPVEPEIAARASVAIDRTSGAILYGRNSKARLPMASTTKIMTALLALERGDPNQVVAVDVDARSFVDSSLMGLFPGERLTLLDLLYGLMLPSGNDAASQIARTIGGSEKSFVELMNQRAKELGLTDTHFANPHGLDAPDHFTTAIDLANLARFALKNPTFAKIVTTSSRTVKGVRTYKLRNTNALLARDDVFGVKTGFTDLAGRCNVVLFRRQGNELIVVDLNSPNRDTMAVRLANYAYNAFGWVEPELPPSPFDREPTSGRLLYSAPKADAFALPAWRATLFRPSFPLSPGEVRFVSAGQTVTTLPLVGP